MGTWGPKPWDNDMAADWFGGLFKKLPLRQAVIDKLNEEVDEDNADEIRAAASLLVFAGRVYVWPVEHFDADLDLAISKLSRVIQDPMVAEYPEYQAGVAAEIEILRARRREGPKPSDVAKAWWSDLA